MSAKVLIYLYIYIYTYIETYGLLCDLCRLYMCNIYAILIIYNIYIMYNVHTRYFPLSLLLLIKLKRALPMHFPTPKFEKHFNLLEGLSS